MHFALLGPLEIHDGERLCTPHRTKLRDLLALLLVRAGGEVSRQSLITDLWNRTPPSTAAPALHVYVSQLRQALFPGVARDAPDQLLQTVPDGYRLAVGPDDCDLLRFECLAGRGMTAMDSGDAALAATTLRNALSLWRGPAFAGISLPVIRDVHAPQLEERRLAVVACRIDAELALGQHEQVIPELKHLTTGNPFNERFAAQLMRALIAGGRHTEALTTFRELNTRLRDGLGLDPGAEMQALRHAAGATEPTPPHHVSSVRSDWQVPAQLPRDLPDFTGRDAAAEEVRRVLRGDTSEGLALPCLITGPAGVGKTSLAVRIAHAVKDQFPDGQLFVDLRGFEQEPLEPTRVLGNLLADLGVDRRFIPSGVRERGELFRTRVADRRLLLLLDNVGSEAQLLPLLPGCSGCGVLVTSRNALATWTGAGRINLDALGVPESIQLLTKILGPDRVARDRPAARRIVDSCGQLPLALRIAATRLSVREHWSLEQFATRLDDTKTRLDELVAGDREVRASVALTYLACTEEEQGLLRLLSSLRLHDFPAWLAAALVGSDTDGAQRVIDRLVEVHLLRVARRDDVGQIRYQFHDLVRLFALEQLERGVSIAARCAAAKRAVGACVTLADRAEARAHPARRRRVPAPEPVWCPIEHGVAPLVDADPLAWMTVETEGLVDAVAAAHQFHLDKHATALADRLSWFFDRRSNYGAWSSTLSLGLDAARRLDDQCVKAALLLHKGNLTAELLTTERQYIDDVIEVYRQSRRISEDQADSYGIAVADLGLSQALVVRGSIDHAERLLAQSLPVFVAEDDSRSCAQLQRVQGMIHYYHGLFDEAAACFATSVELFATIGDEGNRAVLLADLGRARLGQGKLPDAAALFDQAIPQLKENGNFKQAVFWQAFAADVLRAQGDLELAEVGYLRCLDSAAQIGHWWARGLALTGLGEIRLLQREYEEAEKFLHDAVTSFREKNGDSRRAAHAQVVLGRLYLAKGCTTDAIATFRQAANGFSALGITHLRKKAAEGLDQATEAAWGEREFASDHHSAERTSSEKNH